MSPDEALGAGTSLLKASCPLPITDYKEIVLAHGSGGRLSHQLISKIIAPQFANDLLAPLHDGAIFSLGAERVAFSTDSYVVSPIFFPGGDIGRLAVHGTVNDLAMCGARPLYLSVGFILEEGMAMEHFWRIVQSMRAAAEEAGVQLVTGDTKVVDRGKADKIFINTAGIGLVPEGITIQPTRAQVGDKILISGEIAVHGIAIMSVREGLEFETEIASDSAALHGLVHWVRLDVNQVTDSRIVLSHSIVPQNGYPFTVKLRIAYGLTRQGLSARLVANNPTAEPVPYGCCPHPYLSAGTAGLDDWELLLSARSRIDVDQRLTPIGEQHVQAVDADFRTGAAIGSRQLDHAFTGLSPDHDRRFTASLRDRTNGTGVRMSWGSWGRWVQLHTADGPEAGNRVGLAVEPMSCPPNAFNEPSGPPLLHPRQFFEADWDISDLPPRT